MTQRGTSLSRLYLVGGIVGLLSIAYGVLDVQPNPAMGLCLGLVPSIAIAAWLAADTRHTHIAEVYDAGWLFSIGWPFVVPWYAVRTRGRDGWWLAFRLYAIGLAAPIGIVWGIVLRGLIRWRIGTAS
jgi:hypothetical protein